MENENVFKSLEQEFLKKSLEYGREMFVEFLRQKDEELSRNRDRKQLTITSDWKRGNVPALCFANT